MFGEVLESNVAEKWRVNFDGIDWPSVDDLVVRPRATPYSTQLPLHVTRVSRHKYRRLVEPRGRPAAQPRVWIDVDSARSRQDVDESKT